MKILCFFALVFGLALVSGDGIDYWKAIKSDPLNWVDRDLTREVVSGDDSSSLPRWNKEDPHFKSFDDQWKKENFGLDNHNLGRPWKNQDDPQTFLRDDSIISDLTKLPLSGQASSEPWSSTYWPIQYGILSVRYADNDKNTIYTDNSRLTWKESVNKYQEPKDYNDAVAAGNIEDYISQYFSPAEKYDLLVGDTAFTLTNNNKNQGAQYENSNGDVESWMGICHGWAPAAFALPRPQNDVVLTAADGKTKIKFYADDIRGLASLKYASTRRKTLFAGGRCNTQDSKVAKDPASGLITDYTCFDVNPGSWVIILANRLGLQKKSFVIDATFDLQVWNQPMYSYNMTFFNVLNDKQGSLEESKVKAGDLSGSNEAVMKFINKMKSSEATHIVGVSMDIVYIAETSPSHSPPGSSRQVQVNYVFTLELDAQNTIVGGEWLHNKHPDFVWAPVEGTKPKNEEDSEIASSVQGDISSTDVLNKITQYATSASSRGEVLDIVVSYLVAQSSQSTPATELTRLKEAYMKARNDYAEFLNKEN